MHAYGAIKENPEQALDLYTRQSSVAVNVVDLATMAATLANGGVNPRRAWRSCRRSMCRPYWP
jgi:glutaminase